MRRIIASPLFYTNAAAPASSFAYARRTPRRRYRNQKTARVSESATVRGPTQRVDASRLSKLGSPEDSGTVLGRCPKRIAIASGGGVKIDRARKSHGVL